MPKNKGARPKKSRAGGASDTSSMLEILAAHDVHTAPGRTWKKHYSALVVNISVDASDSSVASSGWLSKGSGYNVLNKGRLDFNTATEKDILKAIGSVTPAVLAAEKDIVIIFSAHATVGWGFGDDLSRVVRDDASLLARSELVGAMRFASFVRQASALLEVNIAGIVLNGCNTGTEIVVGERFVPSSARLLSSVLPEIPVVGIVGTCADAKVNGILLPTGMGGKLSPKTVNRLDASVLCLGGACVDGRTDLHVTHQYTPVGIKEYLGLGAEVGENDPYLASGYEESISRLLACDTPRAIDCHGLKILRRARAIGSLGATELRDLLVEYDTQVAAEIAERKVVMEVMAVAGRAVTAVAREALMEAAIDAGREAAIAVRGTIRGAAREAVIAAAIAAGREAAMVAAREAAIVAARREAAVTTTTPMVVMAIGQQPAAPTTTPVEGEDNAVGIVEVHPKPTTP